MEPMIRIEALAKTFTLHLRGGVALRVLDGFSLDVGRGECIVLRAPSGTGKSTILRCVAGNYRIEGGRVLIRGNHELVDVGQAMPRDLIALRRHVIGHVSQFLRVIPRVSALDIVAEPLIDRGAGVEEARSKAGAMLARLGIPARMWALPPATFSGGEQQRINIARVLVVGYPILLLDEPTASLDDVNRGIVLEMINEARRAGAAILAVLHDTGDRDIIATRTVDVAPMEVAA